MKFIYKILIGLFVFNTCLSLFSSFFYSPMAENTIGASDDLGDGTDYESFRIEGSFLSIGTEEIAVFGVSMILSLLFTWAVKSPIPIAVALFGNVIWLLYVKPATILASLDITGSSIIAGLLAMFGIIIGILATLYVIEFFGSQQGVD